MSSETMGVTGRRSQADLRDANEGAAFAALAVCAGITAIVLIAIVVATAGAALCTFAVFGALGLFSRFIAENFASAWIRTNGVRVIERQFPGIHEHASRFASMLGEPLPEIYVVQDGLWNAFAARLAGRKVVVLFSGMVDSILLKGSPRQLAFVVGHELGHHWAGHLNWWTRTVVGLGSWCFWLRLWHSRRCELTCDRYGLLCVGSLEDARRAVCNMAVGASLAHEVDIPLAIAQWRSHRSEFFVKYRTIYSTHPHTLWRLDELGAAAADLRIA